MIHGWSAFGGPTMVGKMLDWKEELGRWLKPFLDRLGHKARRQMCPLYVSGLIGPGDRKSIAPMAEPLARGEVPVMLALRLFLPESWTSKRARLERAGVPTEYRTARTKPEMALAEIDRVIAAGVRFGCVLADAGYGLSAPFRQGLTARKLAWAVGIPRHLKVYPADVQMIWPVAGRGR